MEFKRVKVFTQADISKKKTKFTKEETLIRISHFKYSEEDQVIVCGLTNGGILQFIKKSIDQVNLITGKEYEVVVNLNGCHKGEVKSLAYERIFGRTYLFSGSVDRNIKVWDNDQKNKISCCQTLVGHGGTVMAIQYSSQVDTLFTCSTDKTLRIWKQEKSRNLMYHPWFVCFQVILDFSPKKGMNTTAYLNTITIRPGENVVIFAGDTEGSFHIFKPEESWKQNSAYMLEKTSPNFHRLAIIKIMTIFKENHVFTIGYDQKVQAFEEISGKLFFSYKNPHKALFTAMAWNKVQQELILGDEAGYLYFINIQTDKAVIEYKLYSTKIMGMEFQLTDLDPNEASEQLNATQNLIIVTESNIEVLKIKRGAKRGNIIDGHQGPVIGLESLDPARFKKGTKYVDTARLVSASLDSTIKVWDPRDMTCINVLENKDKYEISAFGYLPYSNLFVTGHENGSIKLWNIDTNHCLVLDQKNLTNKHTDTICCVAPASIFRKTASSEEITEYLFTSGYDGRINIWEISEKKNQQNNILGSLIVPQLKYSMFATKEQKDEQIGHEILCLGFEKNSRNIIAAGNKCEIYFIEMFSYEHKDILKGHKDSINCMILDENYLFTGSDDKTIKIWNCLAKNRYLLWSIDEAHEIGVKQLFMLENTGQLVSCASDGKIHLWNYKDRKRESTIEKSESFRCITYIYSEKVLVAGTEEQNIFCFDLDEVSKENERNEIEIRKNEMEKSTKKKKQVKFQSEYSDDEDEEFSFMEEESDYGKK